MATNEKDPAADQIMEAVRLTRQEEYAAALELFESHLASLTGGAVRDKHMAAAALSYYGLCVAMVRRRYRDAVGYCRLAAKHGFTDPEHRYNLALVHLERDDRRRAVEAIHEGLRLDPSSRRLRELLRQIGQRQRPVIPFLSRNSLLNIWLGKLRARSR